MIVKSVTIGRADDCDLRVHDEYVSPRHARIDQHANGEFTLTDLGSTNGTWIRRQGLPAPMRVALGTTRPLNPGDVVKVGRTEIPWMNEPA